MTTTKKEYIESGEPPSSLRGVYETLKGTKVLKDAVNRANRLKSPEGSEDVRSSIRRLMRPKLPTPKRKIKKLP